MLRTVAQSFAPVTVESEASLGLLLEELRGLLRSGLRLNVSVRAASSVGGGGGSAVVHCQDCGIKGHASRRYGGCSLFIDVPRSGSPPRQVGRHPGCRVQAEMEGSSLLSPPISQSTLSSVDSFAANRLRALKSTTTPERPIRVTSPPKRGSPPSQPPHSPRVTSQPEVAPRQPSKTPRVATPPKVAIAPLSPSAATRPDPLPPPSSALPPGMDEETFMARWPRWHQVIELRRRRFLERRLGGPVVDDRERGINDDFQDKRGRVLDIESWPSLPTPVWDAAGCVTGPGAAGGA